MRKAILAFFVAALSGATFAQSDSVHFIGLSAGTEYGIIAGLHQYDHTFIELGFSKLKYRTNRCAFGTDIHGYTLSGEYNPFQQRVGFSVCAWQSLMASIMTGISINTYSDLNKWDLGIKPMIGIGPGSWQLMYEYNFLLVNNALSGINKHGCFTLRFHIPLVSRETSGLPLGY